METASTISSLAGLSAAGRAVAVARVSAGIAVAKIAYSSS